MLRWALVACAAFAAGCEQPGPHLPVPDQWFVGEVEPIEGLGQFPVHFSDGTTVFARKRQLRRLDMATADHQILHRFHDPILALEVSRDDILYVAADAGYWDPASPSRLFRSDDRGRSMELVFEIHGGSILWWSMDTAVDGALYVGEYGPSDPGYSKTVWKSHDRGETWEIAFQDSLTSESHLHRVAVDPYTGDIWVTRGDVGMRGVYCSRDGGKTWRREFDSQATAVAFTADSIYWGEDSASDPGIREFDRKSGKVTKVLDIDERGNYGGSVYDMSVDLHGNIIASFMKYPAQEHVASLWAGSGEHWEPIAHFVSEQGRGSGRAFVSEADREGWIYVRGYRFRLPGRLAAQ